jgi:hypothetical protein
MFISTQSERFNRPIMTWKLRTARLGIVFLGCAAPLLVMWQLMLTRVVEDGKRATLPASSIPGPTEVTASMLSPVDVLVRFDPWFAGTIWWWRLGGLALVCGCAVLAFRTQPRGRWLADLILWTTISLAAGLLIALPWIVTIGVVVSR